MTLSWPISNKKRPAVLTAPAEWSSRVHLLEPALLQSATLPFRIFLSEFRFKTLLIQKRRIAHWRVLEDAVREACPPDPVITAHLGDAYEQAGRFGDAMQLWIALYFKVAPQMYNPNSANLQRFDPVRSSLR